MTTWLQHLPLRRHDARLCHCVVHTLLLVLPRYEVLSLRRHEANRLPQKAHLRMAASFAIASASAAACCSPTLPCGGMAVCAL